MRVLPQNSFGDDHGTADPTLGRALAAYATGEASYAEAVLALQDTRLLVPVVALFGEVEYDEQGLAHDKSSDMAAVLVQGDDGRRALLAFTGTESLTAWNPQARPVPVPVRQAAQAAVQEDAAALIVDLAGPSTLVIQGRDLVALAAGYRLAMVAGEPAWIGESD